ncbi:MAG TPA: hypothetical protein PLD84_16050, partial [Chitinophagales bacterium]|nr:hypothetical protein [Chitinophagales bacterium]
MKIAITILVMINLMMIRIAFSQITITFTIDDGGNGIGPGGMHIAGQFATDSSLTIATDWDPGADGSAMTLLSGTTWQLEVSFPFSSAGKLLEFEFVRDSAWNIGYVDMSEGNPGDCCLDETCGVTSVSGETNRVLVIPDCSGTYSCFWNTCASLVPSFDMNILVTPQNILLCKGESVQLDASGAPNVVWLADPTLSCDSCNNPIASPDSTTTYYVSAGFGTCFGEENVLVTV